MRERAVCILRTSVFKCIPWHLYNNIVAERNLAYLFGRTFSEDMNVTYDMFVHDLKILILEIYAMLCYEKSLAKINLIKKYYYTGQLLSDYLIQHRFSELINYIYHITSRFALKLL